MTLPSFRYPDKFTKDYCFPESWEKLEHAQTVYTRPSIEGLGTRLVSSMTWVVILWLYSGVGEICYWSPSLSAVPLRWR